VEKSRSEPQAAQDPPGRAKGYEQAKSRKDERRQTSAAPAPVAAAPESEPAPDAAPAAEAALEAAELGKSEDKGKRK
jgi:hypothetical protein